MSPRYIFFGANVSEVAVLIFILSVIFIAQSYLVIQILVLRPNCGTTFPRCSARHLDIGICTAQSHLISSGHIQSFLLRRS